MSRHQESFQLPCPPEKAKQVCWQALGTLGWHIRQDLGYGFLCAEPNQVAFVTWPVTVELVIHPAAAGASLVMLNGSNTGFGPIQSGHVRKQVEALRVGIERTLREPQPPPHPTQTSTQRPASASGRNVTINGVRLRDEEVRALEGRYGVPLPDGAYWYDNVCGAWGIEGQPALCVIEPGLKIGGRLRADASGGGTGVFVNERELHPSEVARLQLIGTVMEGRYWMDPSGNFGFEGGMCLGNIWANAQGNMSSGDGGGRESVLTSWDRTGIAVLG